MPNFESILEAFTNVIKSLADDKKPPLHIGEAMACWTYLAFVEDFINFEVVALNTTTDSELIDLFQDGKKIAKSHEQQLKEFMRREGVELPMEPQPKPKSEPSAVPKGVKFTDRELANTMVINLVMAATLCASGAVQSLRTDVGLMFIKFQLEKMTFGATVKAVMKERGWLKIPPSFMSPGIPSK